MWSNVKKNDLPHISMQCRNTSDPFHRVRYKVTRKHVGPSFIFLSIYISLHTLHDYTTCTRYEL
jgi:hypothetical protein